MLIAECYLLFAAQNREASAQFASSRSTSNICASQSDSGASDSNGTVAAKCGELRRKLTLRKSQSREATSAVIMVVISRCQSLRVVRTKGPQCSTATFPRFLGKFRVRPHQRWV